MVNQSADERHGARIRDGLDEREGLNGWMDAWMDACMDALRFCTVLDCVDCVDCMDCKVCCLISGTLSIYD